MPLHWGAGPLSHHHNLMQSPVGPLFGCAPLSCAGLMHGHCLAALSVISKPAAQCALVPAAQEAAFAQAQQRPAPELLPEHQSRALLALFAGLTTAMGTGSLQSRRQQLLRLCNCTLC